VAASISLSSGDLWSPPVMVGGGALAGLIGFGFLLILPSVPDMVRGAMGIKDTGIGAMAMAPLAAAGGFMGATVGRVTGSAMGGVDKTISDISSDIIGTRINASRYGGPLRRHGWNPRTNQPSGDNDSVETKRTETSQ